MVFFRDDLANRGKPLYRIPGADAAGRFREKDRVRIDDRACPGHGGRGF